MSEAQTPASIKDSQDASNDLDTKLLQLQSMLMMTYGEARETFDSMNDNLRDNYLWACSDMVSDCIKLNARIHMQQAVELMTINTGKEASHA